MTPERVARFSLITTEGFDDQMEEISADLKFGKLNSSLRFRGQISFGDLGVGLIRRWVPP
jgi:hypothetical protein